MLFNKVVCQCLVSISCLLVCILCGLLLNEAMAAETWKKSCGCNSCTPLKAGYINVHLIPHSHMDLGWIYTVDDYFRGYVMGVPKGVKNLITDLLLEINVDPKRRPPDFNYTDFINDLETVLSGVVPMVDEVIIMGDLSIDMSNVGVRFVLAETAYLWMWWQQSNNTMKDLLKKLVNTGQVEIAGGGWSMNDEATTHYQSIIDQFTLGFRKLDEMLGECGIPKVGWQIDPFGHSREMASLFAEMDYEGLFLGRIDHHEKDFRFETKSAEFVWKGSGSLGNSSNILTSILPNIYEPPEGICLSCYPTLSSTVEKFEQTMNKTIMQFIHQANNYATSNLIATMGGDFQYQFPLDTFQSVDLVIRHINNLQEEGQKFNLIYSTPSCYLKAVRDEAKQKKYKFFLKSDDFFPYASEPNSYWTGFYTSRPVIKRLERLGNNYLQICKNLFVLGNLSSTFLPYVETITSEMGILQHHDAITGTSRQYVADDYVARISKGFLSCDKVSSESLNKLMCMNANTRTKKIDFVSCTLTNISQCKITEYLARFAVTVYNPLSRFVNYTVRLPVIWKNSEVLDPCGNAVASDIVPILTAITKHPVKSSKTKNEVVFQATNVPPFGFRIYYVHRMDGNRVLKAKNISHLKFNGIEISLNKTTGKLANVYMNDKSINITQDFLYYTGYGFNRRTYGPSSGAYVFRPYRIPNVINDNATFKVYVGKVVAEIHQYFDNWASQVIRINKAENLVEFDWVIGPIPTRDYGKEVITKYSTPLQTNSTFYTDSNGRQTMKRIRNYRRAFVLASRERVAANYHPVTTKVVLRDEKADIEVAILTDRAQGATSMDDGDVELMLHRVCLYDDGMGVSESLMETAYGEKLVVRGSHYLVFGSLKNNSDDNIVAQEHDIIQRKLLSSWVFVSSTNSMHFKEFKKTYKMEFSGLTKPLPKHVHILTLQPWKKSQLLLRLEHIYEAGEHSDLSKPVTVNIENLFNGFRVTSAIEKTLGANKWKRTYHKDMADVGDTMEDLTKSVTTDTRYWRLKFPECNKTCTREKYRGDFKVTLCPLEIRTFVIDVYRAAF